MSDNNLENMELGEAKEYVQMGQTLLGNGSFAEALPLFDKALKLEPMNEVAYMSKGIAYASMEEYDEAKKCFTRASMIDKTLPDAWFQLGNIAFIRGEFEEGIRLYNRAMGLGFQDAEMYYNLGLVYEEKDEPEMAIRYYGKAHLADELNPVYLIRKATLQLMTQKYEEALQTLENLREKCPESFEGYHLSAAAYMMMEQYDEALEILNFAVQLFPEDKDLILDQMRVLVTKGDIEAAENVIQRAYANEDCTSEDRKELLLNEAQIHGIKEEFSKAEECLEEALKIEEDPEANPELFYLLCSLNLIQKNYEKVLCTARRMDRKDIENTFSLFGAYFEGLALKQLQDASYKNVLQDAVRYYRKITMEDPSKVDCYIFRAMCYRELENFDKAMESLDYVMLLQPENGKIHFIKGNVLSAAGRTEEAKQCYAKAQELGYDTGAFGSIWG